MHWANHATTASAADYGAALARSALGGGGGLTSGSATKGSKGGHGALGGAQPYL